MRKVTFAVIALLVLLHPPLPDAAAGNEVARITFAFTNDVQGYIEPCG